MSGDCFCSAVEHNVIIELRTLPFKQYTHSSNAGQYEKPSSGFNTLEKKKQTFIEALIVFVP
jgi:hypothetical protein